MSLTNGRCDRCGKQTTSHIMSMFNTQDLCLECKDKEKKSPRYEEARRAEEAAVRSGNPNFKGIGL